MLIARETALTFLVMYLFPLLVNFFFFQSYMLRLFFSRLLSCLVGMKRMASRGVVCKRHNSSLSSLCTYLL